MKSLLNNDVRLFVDPITGIAEDTALTDSFTNNDLLTGGTGVSLQTVKEPLQTAQNLLKGFASAPDFGAKMQVAFGNSFNIVSADALAKAWVAGDFSSFPKIEIRNSAEINGALGAFAGATNTIYLSREFLTENAANTEAVASVLLEEIGHAVDTQLNDADTPGDEGEIFSALVRGEKLEAEQLQRMKAEDDTANITLDGQFVQIEQATVSDSGGFEGSTKTLKLDSKGGGTAKYSYEMFTIPDNLMLRYEGKNILETGFVSGNKTGTVQIPKGNSDELEVILATNDEGTLWNYEIKTSSPRKPVLILPGIGGSFVNSSSYDRWTFNRGLNPNELVIDPLTNSYDDLSATLQNAGYKLGEDLFVVPYDWRLAPAPNDGSRNGSISGISATSITDSNYEYGVDYLGYWLRQAAEKWKERFPDADPLDSVDVIAHSTGGLVTRAYIQSAAYGGSFGNLNLPKVDNFIMLGVPNAGAPKAWNPINDDWNSDIAYSIVIRQFANVPYQKLLQGKTINGPTPITQATVIAQSGNSDLESKESKEAFIDQYAPTIKGLLATYNFGATVSPTKENSLLLDLNAGVSSVTSKSNVTVVYGDNLNTITSVQSKIGPKLLYFNGKTGTPVYDRSIESFTTFFNREPLPNEQWWEEFETTDGDGTVPVRSATYVRGNQNQVQAFNGVEHGELPSHEGVQMFILKTLGAKLEEGKQISTTSWLGAFASKLSAAYKGGWNYANDPVDGFLVDSQGRRLGYSQATGAVTEIPNSVWFGNQDGIGWVFGEVDSPATLQLTGLGQDHYVQVSGVQGTQEAGVDSSGFLATGEQKNLNVALTDIPQDPNTPTSGGDLEVSLVANPDTIPLGEDLTYTINIKNNGQNNSTGVVLTEYLSNEMNFIAANASKGQVSQANGIVSVNVGNLNSGENVTATIQVSPFVAGTLTSTANVSSTETDPNPNNDSITTSVNVSSTTPAAADLELKQTVNNPNPNAGDRITFTLTLTNKGQGVASSIKVTDLLPQGLSFVSATPEQGTYDSTTGVWDVGNMRDNLTRTLNIVAQVNNAGIIPTTAAVTSVSETDPDSTPNNNNPNEDDEVSITLNAIGDSAAPTIQVTSPATDITDQNVTINYNAFDADSNAKVSLFYDTDNQGFDGILIANNLEEKDGNGSFNWNTEGIPTGDYYVYAMVVDENNPPVFSYSPGKVRVTEAADLSVTKTANADPVVVGNNLTYSIAVTNNGANNARGVTLTDTLPEGVQLVSTSINPIQQSGNQLTFDLANFNAGETKTVTLTITPPTTGNITGSASVTSKTFDPVATNDIAVLTTSVNPISTDLSISATPLPSTVNLGDKLTYNFTVTNNSPTKATGVTLTDILPSEIRTGEKQNGESEVVIISSKGLASQTKGVVTAELGELNSGESATVTITAASIAAGTFINTASVTSNEADSNPANNSLIQRTTVNPVTPTLADLELTKIVDKANPNVGDQITFTLTLTNKGQGVASSIKVTDLLPQGLSFVSATPEQGTYDSTTGVWDVGNMRDNLTRTLNIVAQVNNAGIIPTTAAVTSVSETDPDSTPNNNNPNEDDQASVTINAIGGVQIGTTNRLTFDDKTYLSLYPDVRDAYNNGGFEKVFDHFTTHGILENRDLRVRLFDETYYLGQNTDVKQAVDAGGFDRAFDHFILWGLNEGRQGSSSDNSSFRLLFDENYYLGQNPDVKQAVDDRGFYSGLLHYFEAGQFEGRKISSSDNYLISA